MIEKNQKKPTNLNIRTIKFPITAIASILHRISGILLFLAIGPMLWIFKLSLSSNDSFFEIRHFLVKYNYVYKFLFWVITIILGYHILAGIRQILMDFRFLNQTLLIGKTSVKIVFILFLLLAVFSGILIWDPLNRVL